MRISFFILLFLSVSMNNCLRNTSNEKKHPDVKEVAGVLRIHPSNSRYFTDNTNKAIYLAGAHTWYNIHIDPERYVFENSHETFEAFLDWLQSYGHNFTRLWTNTSYLNTGPYPWQRTGPGYASDGKLKFDLTKMNQQYFDLLRERVLQIQNRGMYCSIMLFGSFNRMRTEDGWKMLYGIHKTMLIRSWRSLIIPTDTLFLHKIHRHWTFRNYWSLKHWTR